MEYALEQARKSPPRPTNFRVGAVLLDADSNTVIATGYSLELPGNTHAEQTCFMKVGEKNNLPEEAIGERLPTNTVLYTTMEPCNKRLSGNLTCVERILRLGNAIRTVYVGIKEPEKFVGENVGRARLENAGVKVVHVADEGLEQRILETATAGHVRNEWSGLIEVELSWNWGVFLTELARSLVRTYKWRLALCESFDIYQR